MSYLKVYKNPCANCLFTKDRIVPAKRVKQIVNDTLEEQTHFTCHKATMNGQDVCCKNYYDKFKDQNKKLILIQQLDEITKGQCIDFVELQDDDKLPSYNEITNKNQ